MTMLLNWPNWSSNNFKECFMALTMWLETFCLLVNPINHALCHGDIKTHIYEWFVVEIVQKYKYCLDLNQSPDSSYGWEHHFLKVYFDNFALLDFNEIWHMRCLVSNIWYNRWKIALSSIYYEQYQRMYVGKKWQFSSIVPKFSQICKIISYKFDDGLLEHYW